MKPYLYNKILSKLKKYESCYDEAINHPNLKIWSNNTNSNPSVLLSQLLDSYNTNIENALVLYLEVLYNTTHDAELVMLGKDLFDDIKVEKIESLHQDYKQLQEHFDRGWSDVAFTTRRKIEIGNEISTWQQKTHNKFRGEEKMVTVNTNSLDNLITDYAQLKMKKDVYNEFDMIVPEGIVKGIRKLKRQIVALIEMQKDDKRDYLEDELRNAETPKQKRFRLRKELDELGEG